MFTSLWPKARLSSFALTPCTYLQPYTSELPTHPEPSIKFARGGHPLVTRGHSSDSSANNGNGIAKPDFSTVGFVGLGNMGYRMSMNLIRKGYNVIGYDTSNEALDAFAKNGGIKASDIRTLANKVTLIVSMLPALTHVKSVYLGPEGLLKNISKDTKKYIIECSTIGPIGSELLLAQTEQEGHIMIDAPVSGGIQAAEAGTLAFMVGSSDQQFEEVEEFLLNMGKTVVNCGGPTKGQAVKVSNNLILGASMLGVSEGYRLARLLGVDLEVFNRVVNSSTGRCWSSDTYNPVPGVSKNVPASRNYEGGFAVKLMVKDLSLALDAAEASSCKLPLTGSVAALYSKVEEEGFGHLDFSCVYEYIK